MASIYFRQDTGKWQVNIRISGHKPISRQCKTEREAIALAGELEARIRNGETVGGLDKARKITFKQLAEMYVQSSTFFDKKEHTQRTEKSKLFGSAGPLCESCLCDHFGKLTLNQITAEMLNEYKNKRRATHSKKYNRPYSADAIRLELNLIKQIFKFAKNEKGINIPSPFSDGAVKNPKCESTGEVINDTVLFQIRSVFERKRDNLKALHFFLIALDTAMRAGEIQRISKNDIDFDKQTIFLSKTKNGSSRTVIFNSDAVREALEYRVKNCPDDCPYIFYQFTKDGQYRQYDYQESWKQMVKKLKITAKFHWLRHTAITKIYETTDWSDLKIASITGHKSLQSLKIYSHIRAQRIDKTDLEIIANKSEADYFLYDSIKSMVMERDGLTSLDDKAFAEVEKLFYEAKQKSVEGNKRIQQSQLIEKRVLEQQKEQEKQLDSQRIEALQAQLEKLIEQNEMKDKIISKLLDK